MSSAFSIQKPSTLAALPRPINTSNGRYVVSDVHGGMPGSRKRKRNELAVGIDGEGINIYDVQSSKLLTSYALPPQSSFTCPPCSIRLRKPKEGGTERRTYVSTVNSLSDIILFRDYTSSEGFTKSEVVKHKLEGLNEPVLVTSLSAGEQGDLLLVVAKNGGIQCLDGQDLELRWTSPASALSRHSSMPNVSEHTVQFVQITDAYTASKGVLKGRQDALTFFAHPIDRETFNPSILIIITSPTDVTLQPNRTLQVVALPNTTTRGLHSVHTLTSLQLPWMHNERIDSMGDIKYNLQVSSGLLYELASGFLTTFDLTESLPSVKSKVFVHDADSFIPLSDTAIITASKKSIDIYHPTFRSIQASVDLASVVGHDTEPGLKKRKIDEGATPSWTCSLVAHSVKQGVVLAIMDTRLLSFQIEARKDDTGRSRSLGLLIDSIGCGALGSNNRKRLILNPLELNSFGEYLPGSIGDAEFASKTRTLDGFIDQEDIEAFEGEMAKLVGIERNVPEARPKINNITVKKGRREDSPESPRLESNSLPSWNLPKKRSQYPAYDPKWAQYAISRIFNWSNERPTEQMHRSVTANQYRLHVAFFPPNVIHWLIQTGNFNKATITSALQADIQASGSSEIPAGQIVQSLVEEDPGLTLLLSLLSSTYLDATELLHALRLLMDSLELLGETPQEKLRLLTSGERPDYDIEAEIELEGDQADADLQLAEYRLEDGSSVRDQAISLALARLHTCPPLTVVRALQSTLTLTEIVSLIYLLRFELAKGSWTTRYLDLYQLEDSGDDSLTSDSTIVLISSLLGRCIDAVGAGGWLSGDAMLVNGDHFESEELIASLKLEVSAALEGIEESSYLKGLTTEMIRYGESYQKATPRDKNADLKDREIRPIVVSRPGQDTTILPYGLKAEQQISLQKVKAGGELYNRTSRDIGRLKSRKVGKYTRERIVF